MQNRRQKIKLVDKRVVANNTLELLYQANKRLAFIPGQFYSFHFECGNVSKARSYSAANPILNPQLNRELNIAVTLHEEGFASNIFNESKVGEEIEVSGPFGSLILPKRLPNTVFLVATGTGIAPFRSMISQIQESLEKGQTKFILAFGVRSREDLIYDSDFYDLENMYKNFIYEVYFSREEQLRSNEYSGRVTRLFEKHDIDPESTLAFVCGNPEMVDDVVNEFKNSGLVTNQIKREKYTLSPF